MRSDSRIRKVQILIGAVAGALILAALVYATRENDPVYQGKRLSEHLEMFSRCGLRQGGAILGNELDPEPRVILQFADPIALEAVSKVGTNALPMLARMLKVQGLTI